MAAAYNEVSRALTIEGGDGRDIISVRQDGDNFIISQNGLQQSVAKGAALRVEVRGGKGRDRISVEAVTLPLAVLGGGGNDRIFVGVGGGECTLIGDDGNDIIFGSTGDDRILGGTGNDRLFGRGGRDSVHGGNGSDSVDGGDGDDDLWGDEGNDRLRGGKGADRLNDRLGKNRYSGGEGEDVASVPPGSRSAPRGVETRSAYLRVDPAVDAFVTRSADGAVSVAVDAIHGAGGFRRWFGDLETTPGGFRAEVIGEDLYTDQTGARTAAMYVETRTYDLGNLPPGTHTFVIHSSGRVLETLRIGATADGLTPDTPTTPGQYHGGAAPWVPHAEPAAAALRRHLVEGVPPVVG